MNAVFADAFYFVACLNRADQHHRQAVALAAQITGRITTTRWILMEVADALSASASRSQIAGFVHALETDPQVSIIESDIELFHGGLNFYHERSDKDWTLTDCISFVVMKQQNLTAALTGDHHFEQAGFVALLK